MQANKVIEHITTWLKDYCERAGQKGFVVGVSGGIDSAVTSALCARTGLATLCVEMPIHQAFDQVTRAQDHITWLRERHPNAFVPFGLGPHRCVGRHVAMSVLRATLRSAWRARATPGRVPSATSSARPRRSPCGKVARMSSPLYPASLAY